MKSTPRQLALVALHTVSASWLVGCAREERLNPIGETEIVDAGVDAPEEDAGPIVRRVEERNPFGGPPNNLLADGDFELSVSSSTFGQYGWIAFSSGFAQLVMLAETGGICRSGLRCARMKKGQLLYGQGTAAADESAHAAKIFLKPVDALTPSEPPATYECKDLGEVQVFECSTGTILSVLKPDEAPGSDGWCAFTGSPRSSKFGLCMIVELDEDALVDEATLLPVLKDEKTPLSALPSVSTETRAKIDGLREAVRKTRRFGTEPRDPRKPELDP